MRRPPNGSCIKWKRMLYDPAEIEVSERYLLEILQGLRGTYCLLGGWAAHHIVNESFHDRTGRIYIGSRDIDIGFHLDRDWSEADLRESDIARAFEVFEALGFWPLTFRFAKDFHSETGRELTPEEAATLPQHEIFQLYVDPIVDHGNPRFKAAFGFDPIDDPLLSHALMEMRTETLRVSGISFPVPETHVLLAMKLNSAPNRSKGHKKVKDIADIYALLWYADVEVQELKRRLFKIYPKANAKKVIQGFSHEEISEVSKEIGIRTGEVRRVLLELTRA